MSLFVHSFSWKDIFFKLKNLIFLFLHRALLPIPCDLLQWFSLIYNLHYEYLVDHIIQKKQGFVYNFQFSKFLDIQGKDKKMITPNFWFDKIDIILINLKKPIANKRNHCSFFWMGFEHFTMTKLRFITSWFYYLSFCILSLKIASSVLT